MSDLQHFSLDTGYQLLQLHYQIWSMTASANKDSGRRIYPLRKSAPIKDKDDLLKTRIEVHPIYKLVLLIDVLNRKIRSHLDLPDTNHI